jgi:hypothetical protein
MVRESGGIASAIALQIPCQKGIVSSHYSALTPRRSAPLGRGDNFWIGVGGQLTTSFSTAGWRSMADLLGMCQLATSSTGCANPTPLLRPLYPLPHHHRPPSACSRVAREHVPAAGLWDVATDLTVGVTLGVPCRRSSYQRRAHAPVR